MKQHPSSRFQLGPWTVIPSRNLIQSQDQTTQLEQRIMTLLVYLAQNAGEVVPRADLLAAAWPETHTTGHSLTGAISELRKALGDDPRRPQYIETIHKVGYRIMATVTIMANGNPPKKRIPIWIPVAAIILIGLFWVALLLRIDQQPSRRAVIHPKPLTSYPGGEFDPAISPNGRDLAFVWRGETDNLDIYYKAIDDDIAKRVTDHPGFDGSPTWAPNGDALAYMSSARNDCGVYIQALPEGERKRVADCRYHDESSVAWSPNANWLAITDLLENSRTLGLFRIDLDSLARRTLTQPPPSMYGDRDPAFSPSGRLLAFVRGTVPSANVPAVSPLFGDIHVLNLMTDRITRVTHDHQEIPGLSWLGEDEMVFSSNRRGGDFSLWRVKLDGSAPEWILNTGELIRSPFFHQSTQRLVYEQWTRDTNIWRMDLSDGALSGSPESFMMSTRGDTHPQFSPDGKRVAFVSSRTGHDDIWVCDSDGSRPARITNMKGARVQTPKWSPDSRALAFGSWVNGKACIFTMQVGGEPRTLTPLESHCMAPAWSNDGQSVYAASHRSGHWEIWRFPAKTQEDPVQVTSNGGFQAVEYGESLFFTRLERKGLWRQSLLGGEPELVLPDIWNADWDNWEIVNDGVFYVKRISDGKAVIVRYDLDKKTTENLAPIDDNMILGLHGLSVSSDGSTILFTKLDHLTGDILHAQGFRY